MYNNFYGKYRAIVTKVEEDKINTRIQVKCPKVLGDSPSAWCLPCIPFIDLEKKFLYEFKVSGSSDDHSHTTKRELPLRVPKVGDPVWIEFEGGNLSNPIWLGTWR